jgi:manganese-dependent inorganic pyrophosphatase
MDSIGSAIGAAEIFGGTASRASDINTETAFALEHFGISVPPPFLDVSTGRNVCLVDHNQVSQMTAGIDPTFVRGIIDHHAMQKGALCTDAPIYVDIRPWGSACTIIAHMAVARRMPLRPSTAGLLLCGILSDTLNLRSPTTTRFDRVLAGFLARLAGVEDPDGLAQGLFKAKSRMLETMTPHGLVGGDLKSFECRYIICLFLLGEM